MPPDVFLVLASSGIAFVASLMFFVSDDPPPAASDDPRLWTSFALPPLRAVQLPPPLPLARPDPDAYGYHAQYGATRYRMRLSYQKEQGDWLMEVEYEPLADSPALRVEDVEGSQAVYGKGQVNDLRWDGRAGLARKARSHWRKPPADA